MYRKASTGVGQEEELVKSVELKFASDWSPDGRFLLYEQQNPKTGWDLWLLPLEGDRKPVPWLQTSFWERSGRISPDGRWVAYVSDESSKQEIYVQPFRQGSGGKWQISTGGGNYPRDRKSTRLNSSHIQKSRMPSSA